MVRVGQERQAKAPAFHLPSVERVGSLSGWRLYWAERADGRPGCAIITEPARGPAKAIHDRMPLILDDDSLEAWLDPDLTDREKIRNIVRHIDAELIEHWPVSTAVTNRQRVPPSAKNMASFINGISSRLLGIWGIL
ncbi:SOS response-associated peptidase family protein [Vreelandella rituensis]|nr:SOS response-associated peptidase family protein [Halomonas rituensis]